MTLIRALFLKCKFKITILVLKLVAQSFVGVSNFFTKMLKDCF